MKTENLTSCLYGNEEALEHFTGPRAYKEQALQRLPQKRRDTFGQDEQGLLHSWPQLGATGPARTDKRLSGSPTLRCSAAAAGALAKPGRSQTRDHRSGERTETPQPLPPGHLPRLGAAAQEGRRSGTPSGCRVDTVTWAGSTPCRA